jgi:ribosome recycling factor
MSLLRAAIAQARSASTRLRLAHHHIRPQPSIVTQARFYASKSKKSKHADREPAADEEAFVPGSQRIAAGEFHHKAEESMKAYLERFRKEVSSLETRASGRVTTGLLAPVRVKLPEHDSKGVRLEEVATVGVREGTTLMVTVFEEYVRVDRSPRSFVCVCMSSSR